MKPRNVKKFDKYDVLSVLYLIYKNENISRKALSDILSLGEGSVKSILNILYDKRVIEKSQLGNCISSYGENFCNNLFKFVQSVNKLNYDIFKDGFDAYSVILNQYDEKKLENIYFARDYAIREGCWSAMILFYDGCDIKLNQFEKYNFNELKDELEIKKDDLIVLVSSSNLRISYKGLFKIIEFLNVEFNNLLKYLE